MTNASLRKIGVWALSVTHSIDYFFSSPVTISADHIFDILSIFSVGSIVPHSLPRQHTWLPQNELHAIALRFSHNSSRQSKLKSHCGLRVSCVMTRRTLKMVRPESESSCDCVKALLFVSTTQCTSGGRYSRKI